ncbi:MAG: hypothetical protein HFI36_05070 [Bacilli bacterium]|jgi:hypothetical protein|nr:hypothetical protein [Bacilli bacterium]
MHTEVFNNIDILMNMANSPLNVEEINMELASLKRQIKNKQNEIDDLKSLMTESRYFNASNELVDKNIEISLKNKITRLNRRIKEIKFSLEESKNNEKKLHTEISTLKEKLAKNENYLETLRVKANSATNNNYYQNLLDKEQKSVEELNKELSEKSKMYESALKELELNNQAFNELSSKLDTEKTRLNDVLDNLENPNAYIDEDLKARDEEKLATLNSELEQLEKRKVELLTDSNMIGADAKELIIENDIYEALNKIKELVTIVKSKPYMDISSSSILEEELEKKESLRVELSTLIDNKKYDEIDTDIVTKRIDYLKSEITENNQTIEKYQNEINNIDKFVNDKLGVFVTELENTILRLEKSINECRTILKDKNKTARSKMNLESTITKKEKEKEIQNEILESYKQDLLSKIAQTNTLASLIDTLNNTNNLYTKELENLNKVALLDFKTKDLAEEENDKEQLKQINEEIKNIKNRQKFDKTPDEIFDQIDMILGSEKSMAKEEKNEEVVNGLEIDSLFSNNETEKETEKTIIEEKEPNKRLKVIEIIPVETIKNDSTNSEASGGN